MNEYPGLSYKKDIEIEIDKKMKNKKEKKNKKKRKDFSTKWKTNVIIRK